MSYSRWLLADLQVHTPVDRDHRYGAVPREPNSTFADALIKAFSDTGVRIIGLTDHNSVAWWPELAASGQRYGVFVFPGIEVNVNKCHLILLWERNPTGYEQAQHFLASVFGAGVIPFSAGAPRPVTSGSPLDIARNGVASGALVFAPHATASEMGLFGKNVCNISSEVAQSGLLSGYDVWGNARAEVLRNPRNEFGDRVPSWFISGDTRSLTDVGRRSVYLKVDKKPSLESIRQAFLMPSTRIRFPEHLRAEWGHVQHVDFLKTAEPSWSRIGRVSIAGGFHDSLHVSFGPGLSAIIGGKGTGKSTLIEILRYVLEAPPSIAPPATAREGEGNREANFPANAEATIEYHDARGDVYSVHRVGDSPRAQLRHAGEPIDVEVSRRARIRLFGQRELAELHRQPSALRDFVARQTEPAAHQVNSEVTNAARRARDLSEELDKIEITLLRTVEASEELSDLSERLSRLSAQGAEVLVQESNALSQTDAAVRSLVEWSEHLAVLLDPLRARSAAPLLPDHPLLPQEVSTARSEGEATLLAAINELQGVIGTLVRDFQHGRDAWSTVAEPARQDLNRRLADAGLTHAAELGQLQHRLAQLQQQLADVPGHRARLEQLIRDRERAIDGLGASRRARSRLVERAARELNQRTGPRVRVRVEALADRAELSEFFVANVTNRRLTTDQAARIARLTPQDIAAAARSGKTALTAIGLSPAVAERVVSLSASKLRELEEVDTPDAVAVEVDLGPAGEPRWTDISAVSPGQAATAMLSLALVSTEEPLVIDQPEDDLDNRFIYDEVVQLLADVASHRQVIVATHNANIPVLGDAELVLALDAVEGRGRSVACGGLDDPRVANMARHILEGGDEAFAARARRYSSGRRQSS